MRRRSSSASTRAAQAMAEASRRADRDGPANALFLALVPPRSADAAPLAGRVDLVIGDDALGFAAARRPRPRRWRRPRGHRRDPGTGGRLEVLASVVPTDRVAGLDALGGGHEPAVRAAWRTAGLRLETMSPASIEDVRSTGSSWARRLGAGQQSRPVWRLTGTRELGPGNVGQIGREPGHGGGRPRTRRGATIGGARAPDPGVRPRRGTRPMRHIVVIGLMSSGKTTIGAAIGAASGGHISTPMPISWP